MIERTETYFRNMNLHDRDYPMQIRFLWKAYQTGISPMYTVEERREILRGFIEDAKSKEDLNAKAIDLAFAYKIARYNGFDVKIDPIDLPEPLIIRPFPQELPEEIKDGLRGAGQYEKIMRKMDRMSPDEEVYRMFHVTIPKDHFFLSTFKYNYTTDGITEDMSETERNNRYNSNWMRRIALDLPYAGCTDITCCCLLKSDDTEIESSPIENEMALNRLRDPGGDEEEKYRLTCKKGSVSYMIEMQCSISDQSMMECMRLNEDRAIVTTERAGEKTRTVVEGETLLRDIMTIFN